jgi:hypothetical protein
MKPDTPPVKCAVCGAPLHVVVTRTVTHTFVDGDITESLKYSPISSEDPATTTIQCSVDASHRQPYEDVRKLIHDALIHSMPKHVTMGPDENGIGFNFAEAGGYDDEGDLFMTYYQGIHATYAIAVRVEVQQVC